MAAAQEAVPTGGAVPVGSRIGVVSAIVVVAAGLVGLYVALDTWMCVYAAMMDVEDGVYGAPRYTPILWCVIEISALVFVVFLVRLVWLRDTERLSRRGFHGRVLGTALAFALGWWALAAEVQGTRANVPRLELTIADPTARVGFFQIDAVGRGLPCRVRHLSRGEMEFYPKLERETEGEIVRRLEALGLTVTVRHSSVRAPDDQKNP
jgi:hypothetical protein